MQQPMPNGRSFRQCVEWINEGRVEPEPFDNRLSLSEYRLLGRRRIVVDEGLSSVFEAFRSWRITVRILSFSELPIGSGLDRSTNLRAACCRQVLRHGKRRFPKPLHFFPQSTRSRSGSLSSYRASSAPSVPAIPLGSQPRCRVLRLFLPDRVYLCAGQ